MGTGVNVSKGQVYAVLGPPGDISVSKAVVYAVLAPPRGIYVSKAVAYAVLQPMDPGVNVSKAVVYAVLHEEEIPTAPTPIDDLGAISDEALGALTRIAGDEALDQLAIADLVSASLWRAITSSLVDSLGAIQDIVSGTLNPVRYASVIDSLSLSDTAKGAGITLSSRNRWIAPIDITPATGLIDPVHIAAHPIRHPEKFYEPRVKSYGQFTRSIGVPVGFVRTGDCQLSIVDADNQFRQAISPKTIINGRAEVRLGPEGGPLSAFLRPFIRSVSAVDQPGDGEIRITLRDFITQSFEQQIPPLVTQENFPNLPKESNGAFAPIVYGNVSVQNYVGNVSGGGGFIENFFADMIKVILHKYFVGPNPGGAIKPILVDPSTNTYLVARHPCRSVNAWKYVDDVTGFKPVGNQGTPIEDLLGEDVWQTAYTAQIPSGEICQFIRINDDIEGAEIRVNVVGMIDFAGTGGALNEFIGFYGHGEPYIDSIGMIYSPVSDDEIRRTDEAGYEKAWQIAAPLESSGQEASAPINNFIGFFGNAWPYVRALGLIYSSVDSDEAIRTEKVGSDVNWVNIELPETSTETNNFVGFFGKCWRYVDTIGVLYSQEGSSTIKRTGEAGDGTGGVAFADTAIPAGNTISGIRIWSGDYIDAIQLIYNNPITGTTYGTKHGGSGGTMKLFIFRPGEYILRIRGKYGRYIDSLVIETNLRTSVWYGGTEGAHGSYSITLNTPSTPEEITPVEGVAFSDGPIPDGCRIASIRVWAAAHVDALQLSYKNSSGIETFGSKHGGDGGNLSILTLDFGEYILEVKGKYGEFIDTMTIVTNIRTVTFGRGIGLIGPYSLKLNAAPVPGSGDPVVVGRFAFSDGPIPDGCRIAGIRIWHGRYIDALQLIYEDGDENITYGTKHGGSGGDMAVFALAEDEYIVSISGKWGDHIDSLKITTNLRTSPKYGGTGGTWGTYELVINGSAADATNPAVIAAQSGENFSDAILEMLTAHLGVEKSAEFINSESFTATRSRVANLICSGAFTKPITWGEALTQLQRSSNIDLFCDRHDRLTVRYATDDDEPVVNLTDLTELYGGSVRQSMAAPAFNRLPYRFMPNYADDTWEEKSWDNVGDQVASGAIMADEPLQLYFVRDPETALKVTERRGDFVDLDAFRFEGTVPLIPTVDKLELAQIVGIDHFGGMKSGGYVNEQFKITDLSMDLDNLAYNFKGIRRRIPTPAVVEGIVPGRTAINARNGPFYNQVDGELFSVFLHETQNRVTVLRSVDYGAHWTESDFDNAPALGTTTIESFDAVALDGDIHIATQEKTTGKILYHVYSMSQQEWTTTDDVVLASISNFASCAVSIEPRYPDGQMFIYFRGERELISGTWCPRGHVTRLISGSWSEPVQVTNGLADDYVIERVISGRNNRMHFFYRHNYIGWAVSMSEGGTITTPVEVVYNRIYNYTAQHNIGGWAISSDRTRIVIPRRLPYAAGAVTSVSEGYSVADAVYGATLDIGFVPSYWSNANPSCFAYLDDEDAVAVFADASARQVVMVELGSDYKVIRYSAIQAGPTSDFLDQFNSNSVGIVGNIFTVRGRKYLSYLIGTYPYGLKQAWKSRWLRIDRLPYTG